MLVATPLGSASYQLTHSNHSSFLQGSFVRSGLTQPQCETEVVLQIVAGSDTTGNVIKTSMVYLATHPVVYRKLQAEIDAAISEGRVSSPVITNAEAKTLPYLQACIYEFLRIHPPNFVLLTKVVPPAGDTLQGRFVPGGTKIAENMWGVLRHEPTFGADAHVFRPERWLEADEEPERKKKMERVCELVFGHGRFMCAGKVLSFLELNKIFVEVCDHRRSWGVGVLVC
jgi:cytochrome P450